jgi:methionine-rich copper-binding protein CopC
MKKRALILSAAIALIPLGMTAASAHTVLIASSPLKNSVIAKLPTKIRLTFAEALLTLGKNPINQVVVKDAAGMVVTNQANKVSGAILTNTISDAAPMAGRYEVDYRVSADDGHIVTGKFFFTLKNS